MLHTKLISDALQDTPAMHDLRPMTVYWDRSCSLCRGEIEALNLPNYGFVLSDCSAPDFDDAHAIACGITPEEMLNALHVLDADGHWHKGIDAFEIIYRRAGHTAIANWLARPGLRPLHDKLYATIAGNRHILSRLGLTKPWTALVSWMQNRKSAHRSERTT
ncbi:MAG: thiol-disulfide oxidoreductase DCC family protein [Gammaproteobacteria bacterium]